MGSGDLVLELGSQLSDVMQRRPQHDQCARTLNSDSKAVSDELAESSRNVAIPEAPGRRPSVQEMAD